MNQFGSKSIDMIFCDLPYGTQKANGCKWDAIIPFQPLWQEYNRIIKDNGAVVLFGKEPFTSMMICSNIKQFKYRWVWEKDTKSNFMQANYQPLNNIEDICVFSKAYAREIKNGIKMKYNPQFVTGKAYKIPKQSKTTEIFASNFKNGIYKHTIRDTSKRYPFISLKFNIDKPKIHPAQKPVALCEYLIRTYTNENDIVLDNCMGSGTTGVACMNIDRKFIGIEKEEKYCQIAQQRIEEALPMTDKLNNYQ